MLELSASSIIRSHERVKVCHTYHEARSTSIAMPQHVKNAIIGSSGCDSTIDYLLKTRLRLQLMITVLLNLLILAAVP